MTIVNYYVCDRCENTIKGAKGELDTDRILVANRGVYTDSETYSYSGEAPKLFHLCQSCKGDFWYEFMGEGR